MGRPTRYSEGRKNKIIKRIIAGEPIEKICKDDDMPAERTFYHWLKEKEEFLQEYIRAKKIQGYYLDEKQLHMLLNPREYIDSYVDEDEQICLDSATVNLYRAQIQAMDRLAARMNLKAYADKAETIDDEPITINLNLNADKPQSVEETE